MGRKTDRLHDQPAVEQHVVALELLLGGEEQHAGSAVELGGAGRRGRVSGCGGCVRGRDGRAQIEELLGAGRQVGRPLAGHAIVGAGRRLALAGRLACDLEALQGRARDEVDAPGLGVGPRRVGSGVGEKATG